MQFGRFPVSGASGAILAYSVRAKGVAFKKGRVLTPADIVALNLAGITEVTLARPEADEIGEDEAASRLARAAAGGGTRVGAAFTGRANLYAQAHGLALINARKIDTVNGVDEAITLASLAPFALVRQRQMLATIKIIPFAVKTASVIQAEALLDDGAVRVAPFLPHRAGLILTTTPTTNPALLDKTRASLDKRLQALGSKITFETRCAHETNMLAQAIANAVRAGVDPILVFGATAITDRRDVIPAAFERAGGCIERFGMPVDPGNLLLVGQIGKARIIGLPGCARSLKLNGFDLVLRRLLAGLPVGQTEIVAMGVGGLLGEIQSRPQPHEAQSEVPRMPRIGAVVLAAGQAKRMRTNKLLELIGSKPLIRHAVEAALGSAADPVIVVTGNEAEKIRTALESLPVIFVENRDFTDGLSRSLKCGLNVLPSDCEGALILLGDMPGVGTGLIDRLIAAFDPTEGRSIVLPVHGGRRGNPVLWARQFFDEMERLNGDAGARSLLARHGELVCEVESGDEAPLTDIDTPEALMAYRAMASNSRAVGHKK